MANRKPKLEITTHPATSPAQGTSEPLEEHAETPQEARARAAQCHTALQQVLAEHGCTIVPVILPPVRVGDAGSTVQVSATYSIVPLPRS